MKAIFCLSSRCALYESHCLPPYQMCLAWKPPSTSLPDVSCMIAIVCLFLSCLTAIVCLCFRCTFQPSTLSTSLSTPWALVHPVQTATLIYSCSRSKSVGHLATYCSFILDTQHCGIVYFVPAGKLSWLPLSYMLLLKVDNHRHGQVVRA